MGRHALFVFALLYSVATLAVGDNTHGQGVRFSGFGFDEQDALRPSQWVPWYGNSSGNWPPQNGTYNSIGGGTNQIRVEVQCDQDPIVDPLFALCSGTVYKVVSGSPKAITACDSKAAHRSGRRAGPAPGLKPVQLLAIRGKWNTTPGAFDKNDGVVTFACAPTIEPKPQWLHEIEPFTGDPLDTRKTNLDESPDLGVLAKCYFWGFAGVGQARKSDTSRLATYQACLRAARAEYCGGGLSQTEQGTIIQVYEPRETHAGPPTVTLGLQYCKKEGIKNPKSSKPVAQKQGLEFQPCFEALWDSEKALCVSHARYTDMPVKDCQNNFPNEFTAVVGHDEVRVSLAKPGDKVFLNCQINDYQMVIRNALIKNRSGLNKLKGQPVKSCTNDIPCP